MRSPAEAPPLRTVPLLLMLAAAVACSDAATLAPTDPPSYSKGGGGGGGSGDIVVSATDPTGAPQDTTLDVKVSGNNFERDAEVVLVLGGDESPNVRTNSTRYVNSKQLVANITISADAEIGSYDVLVRSGNKQGIGTELFTISAKGPINNPRTTFIYYDAPGTSGGGIFGDNRAANGVLANLPRNESTYVDGLCGAKGQIFENMRGDATMDPIGGKVNRNNCAGHALGARSLTLVFGTPIAGVARSPYTHGHYTNIREVLTITEAATVERAFRLMVRHHSSCPNLRYGTIDAAGNIGPLTLTIDGVEVTSRPIAVTRTAHGEWIARSQPDDQGRHAAFCEQGGSLNPDPPPHVGTIDGAYDVPFEIVLRQN